jgi:hypothetical protein
MVVNMAGFLFVWALSGDERKVIIAALHVAL